MPATLTHHRIAAKVMAGAKNEPCVLAVKVLNLWR
jgi:hypothetical protein